MGQYYKYFNLDKKVCLAPRGLKLTEHSWMGNNDVLALLQLVKTEWKNDRIIQLGDYADSEEHYSKMLQEILKVPSNLYDSKKYKKMSFEEYYDKNKLRYISKNVEMENSSTDYKWTEYIFEPLGRTENNFHCRIFAICIMPQEENGWIRLKSLRHMFGTIRKTKQYHSESLTLIRCLLQ